MLKSLLKKLTNNPSDEYKRDTVHMMRRARRIRSSDDAAASSRAVPQFAPATDVRHDN